MRKRPPWVIVLLFVIIMVVIIAAVLLAVGPIRPKKYSSDTSIRYCIDGHEFFFVTAGSTGGLAQHIGDDGLPVKCKREEMGK